MAHTPIRILQIIPSAYQGSGILQVVLNWHRHLDREKVQFDYLFPKPIKNPARAEIEELGGRMYELPHPYSHPVRFLRESYRFFKERRYHTAHSHVTNLNMIFYPLAKIFGARNIIQHAHAIKWGFSPLSNARNYLMLHAVWPLITHKMACSKLAGTAYYGKNFAVVLNNIDIKKFTYNSEIRAIKRKELGLENAFVIGHIGRFNPEKNHLFLLDVFADVMKRDPTTKLVLVGDGPLEKKIKDYAKTKGIAEKICFLGIRRDIAELYQAFDCFVFPSLHEGFGLVAVEAQAAGLPCILADTLPQEAFICNYKKLPLGSAQKWAEEILSFTNAFTRTDTLEKVRAAGFSAQSIARQMQLFYENLEGQL